MIQFQEAIPETLNICYIGLGLTYIGDVSSHQHIGKSLSFYQMQVYHSVSQAIYQNLPHQMDLLLFHLPLVYLKNAYCNTSPCLLENTEYTLFFSKIYY